VAVGDGWVVVNLLRLAFLGYLGIFGLTVVLVFTHSKMAPRVFIRILR
jgi:hypothetical protein